MSENAIHHADSDAVENAAVPRDRAGRFGRGNPGHRLRVAAAERGEAPVPASKLLRAMRAVTTTPETKDRTQLVKECRAWLKEDRKSFLSKLCDLEKALTLVRGRRAAAEGPAGGPDGPGGLLADRPSERTEELCRQLLAEGAWDADQEREQCALLAEKMGAVPAVVQAIRSRTWGPNNG